MKSLNDEGIIHRDLKPENLLYCSEDEHSDLKVTDFGVGRFLDANEMATTAVGTPSYMAPEVCSGQKYGQEVDCWALGTIIYIMLCGFPPFYSENGNNQALFEAIKAGKFDFPSPYWDKISNSAKDLIKSCLVVDPAARNTAEGILEHPWISNAENA